MCQKLTMYGMFVYDQVEESTSSSMYTLMELDGIKSRMQQTADALQVDSLHNCIGLRDVSFNNTLH
jgi:hypothetical protein